MLGIAVHAGCAYGLGLLFPARSSGESAIGLRFTAGVALLLIVFCAASAALPLSLRAAAALVALLAVLGWLRAVFRLDCVTLREAALHPAIVLILLAALAVLLNQGIDYLPYTTDEFTNWIGVSRVIHWAGSYDAVRETLYLPGYTPGWRLLMVLPWQINGEVEFGLSAAAPLVLHIAVLALAYDLFVTALHRDTGLSSGKARLVAWLALLLLLAVEASGRLWTYEMLVEQPQVYLLSAAVLLALRADLLPATRLTSYLAAGLVLAGGFLIKNAVAAAIPGAGLVALTPLLDRSRAPGVRIRESLIAGVALLAPIMIAMAAWHVLGPRDGCLASPLATLTTAAREVYDPLDLAKRYGAEVIGYINSYKLPVTIAAAVGFALAVHLSLLRSVLLWLGLGVSYFFALYWYHLTCFDAYHYQALNSIPRFTRVPLQVFHLLGLVLLGIALLRLVSRHRNHWILWFKESKIPIAIGCILVLVLGAWQLRQTYRTVADLTTRVYQNVDPRIAEMERAAEYLRRHAGRDLPARPRLAILGQGQDGDVRSYAAYYAQHPTRSGIVSLFEIYPVSSWAPVAGNAWQVSASADEVAQALGSVDLIWPIQVDDWLKSAVLSQLVSEVDCLARLPQVVLVREVAGTSSRFRCRPKTG